jgi:hypothetical protein
VIVRLSDVTAEPVSWLWPGRIPFGKLSTIEGNPGLGKSTLTLDLAARLTTGRPFPDGDSQEAAGVVILSAEDGLADTIRPRLEAAGADLNRIYALTAVRLQNGEEVLPAISENLQQIEQEVVRTGARLVIIDPLMAYLGGKTDSYKDQDIRRVLAPLARMASDTQAAVVLVRHLRKSGDGGAIQAGGGSIGIIGAARSGLLVGQHPDDPDLRVVAPIKANLSRMACPLAYRIAEKRIETGEAPYLEWQAEPVSFSADDLLGAGKGDHSLLGEAESFLQKLLSLGPLASNEVEHLARENGISTRTLDRARKRLGVKARLVGGTWTLFAAENSSESAKDANPARRLPDIGKLVPTAPAEEVSALGTLESRDEDPPSVGMPNLEPERQERACSKFKRADADPTARCEECGWLKPFHPFARLPMALSATKELL